MATNIVPMKASTITLIIAEGRKVIANCDGVEVAVPERTHTYVAESARFGQFEPPRGKVVDTRGWEADDAAGLLEVPHE